MRVFLCHRAPRIRLSVRFLPFYLLLTILTTAVQSQTCDNSNNPYCGNVPQFNTFCCASPNICYWMRDGYGACCHARETCTAVRNGVTTYVYGPGATPTITITIPSTTAVVVPPTSTYCTSATVLTVTQTSAGVTVTTTPGAVTVVTVVPSDAGNQGYTTTITAFSTIGNLLVGGATLAAKSSFGLASFTMVSLLFALMVFL